MPQAGQELPRVSRGVQSDHRSYSLNTTTVFQGAGTTHAQAAKPRKTIVPRRMKLSVREEGGRRTAIFPPGAAATQRMTPAQSRIYERLFQVFSRIAATGETGTDQLDDPSFKTAVLRILAQRKRQLKERDVTGLMDEFIFALAHDTTPEAKSVRSVLEEAGMSLSSHDDTFIFSRKQAQHVVDPAALTAPAQPAPESEQPAKRPRRFLFKPRKA
ncbi:MULTISPECIES: hypothetical protein [Actibacterium]|uniref:Uncharacterized protein n=1 Tax=Actibacterium naphthalenivorans TaxID=1614693 RepID=A0A840CF11_9RHOB|nr:MULTISPECIES: hypothetical protein [Actibacterium]ALG91521.1 hypothetical protein TQ29_16650 [Actibacterium sp. EMB200-NS6]MBB4021869.1 hypothetical protein [Actibacterium naphthalenivorans]